MAQSVTKNRLLALDGNSLMNRAFYGVRPLSNREGVPTHALYGFTQILLKLLDDWTPAAVCGTFDLRAPTFRHALYDGYKARRKPMPEDLAAQMPLGRDLLGALRIPGVEREGYEADDLLGTISRVCADEGWECLIVTGDRDSFQLVRPNVSVLHVATQAGQTQTALTGEPEIQARYGLSPSQLIDLKALMGDSSDDIPGVPGVGEKTALGLMQTYGSLDKLYENLPALPEKQRAKLEAHRDLALLSRKLAEIDRNVPLDFRPGDCLLRPHDDAQIRLLFDKWGFTKLLERVTRRAAPPPPAMAEGENLSMFDQPEVLPPGVARHVKELWRAELDAGKPLTPYTADIGLAAWLCGHEDSWDGLQAELKTLGLEKLFYEIEMPLCEVLAHMEHAGIAADRERLTAYGATLGERLRTLEQEVYELAGQTFNLLSPKQLGEVLFERLSLPHGKKTKTGWSTDAETLQALRDDHPMVPKLLEYRTLSKLKATYADGLLKVLGPDGRIHSTFQMTSTVTGRLSSTEPNLQNIPVRQELGAELRRMFVAQDGWVLVDADYSQIELRVLAQIAGDRAMQEAFASGEDIHTVTASQVFGVSLSEVTPLMRRSAKAVNFGIVYGIGDYSLSQDLGVTRAEARRYIDAYLEKYAGVRAYMADIVATAHRDGYVTTLYGRRRTLPELRSPNFNMRSFGERAALNTPIQGTAADLIKQAMVNVHRRLKRENLRARLVLQVHDELIVECPEDERETVLPLLREEMEGVMPGVLVADAHAAKSWYDAK
jgi:DNA polymerase-1